MKKVYNSIILVFLICTLLEIILVAFDFCFSPKLLHNYTIDKEMVYNKLTSHIDPFYKSKFCNYIHQTAEGHELLAKCISEYFNKKFKISPNSKIVAIGASTTEGDDCESGTRWTTQLEKILNIKVINLGESGKNSDNAIFKLKKELAIHEIPEFVIEGDWHAEFIEESIAPSNFKLFFYRLHASFYKYFRTFRLLNNYMIKYKKNNPNLDIITGPENKNPKEELLQGRKVHYTNSFNSFEWAIKKYEKNMKILNELSQKYHFKVIILNFPYVKNYYLQISKDLNDFFEFAWFPQIKSKQKEVAIGYNFEFLDAEKCFAEYKEAAKNHP
jgi:hypothetical protein